MPRALLSVFDKTGVVDFARALHDLGWELLSSGGTAKVIADAGIPVIDVATVTGYPAILGHRVVTLHPSIHGALLADTDNAEHVADMHTHNIEPIALAAINLYPFSSNPSIELIDVGGPAMVRAAAKNYKDVVCVSSVNDYVEFLDLISENNGTLSEEDRRRFATKSFNVSSHYDSAIFNYFNTDNQETVLKISETEGKALRYGENPHQKGFEHSFVLLEGAGNHYNSQSVLRKGYSNYTEDGEPTKWIDGDYSTDFYTNKIIEYIDEDKDDDKPFFAFAAFTSPHWPLQVDKKYWENYRKS